MGFRVVVVDERRILGDCIATLRDEGYDVATCDYQQGHEALSALADRSSNVVSVTVCQSPEQSLALLRAGLQMAERNRGGSDQHAVGFLVADARLSGSGRNRISTELIKQELPTGTAIVPARVTPPGANRLHTITLEPTLAAKAPARIGNPAGRKKAVSRRRPAALKRFAQQPLAVAASIALVGLTVNSVRAHHANPAGPAVSVLSGGVVTATPDSGYLTLDTKPYGTVFINGRDLGLTPLYRHALSPGRYVVEIRHPGYITRVDTVAITPGNESRQRRVLLPER